MTTVNKARRRLLSLFDEKTFVEIDAMMECGMHIGYGKIGEKRICAFSQDVQYQSGAVNAVQMQKTRKIYQLAMSMGIPIVGIYDSQGVQISDDFTVLRTYSQIISLLSKASGTIPQISLILGKCSGTNAYIASAADFVIKEKSALFDFTSVDHEKEAEPFGESGVDFTEENEEEAILKARTLLQMLPSNNLAPVPAFDYQSLSSSFTKDLDGIAFLEQIGDANHTIEIKKEIGKCVIVALTTVAGNTAGVVMTHPKKNKICKNGIDKAARFIRFCDLFSIPIVTFIDFPDDPQQTGYLSVPLFAKLASVYAEATTPKISVIKGNAIGFSYAAMAGENADMTLAWDSAHILMLPSETAVEFLWHDQLKNRKQDLASARKQLSDEYLQNYATVQKAGVFGLVDKIILPEETRTEILHALELLKTKRVMNMPKKYPNMPL